MLQFDELGRQIGEALDVDAPASEGAVGDERRLRQRQALIEHAARGGARASAWVWPSLGAAATVGLLAWWLLPVDDPSGDEADRAVVQRTAEGAELFAGMFLAAPADQALEIELSGGAKVALSPGGRGRVADVSDDRVGLVLEGGELEASVIGEHATAWRVEAGPLSVVATHAVFRVVWDPERYHFRLVVADGEVRVHGGQLGDEGVVVRAGQRLEADDVSVRVGTVEDELALRDRAAVEPEDAEVVADTLDPVVEELAARPVGSVGKEAASTRPPAETPTAAWLMAAEEGRYREALREAEGVGFDALVRELDPEPLKKLADTARLARDAPRARQALSALRDRHADAPQATLAAFLLGRVAFDLDHDYVTAAHWFTTYEAESPSGRFAAEARGRVIDALQRSGDHERARNAARIYLKKHPEGPYQALAQSVTQGRP